MLQTIKEVFTNTYLTLFIYAVLLILGVVHGQKIQEQIDEGSVYFMPLDPLAQDIANKLIAVGLANHLDLAKVVVYEAATNDINGFTWVDERIIGLTTGLEKYSLMTSGSYEYLTAVLAHELGHVLSPPTGTNSTGFKNDELMADYMGTYLLYKAGYDCNLGTKWIAQIEKDFKGSGDEDNIHPKYTTRTENMTKVCNTLKQTGKMPTDLYLLK